MTVENLETNGTQTPATTEEKTSSPRGKATTAKTAKDKEVVALSVKNNAESASKALKFYQPEHRLPENRPVGTSHCTLAKLIQSWVIVPLLPMKSMIPKL